MSKSAQRQVFEGFLEAFDRQDFDAVFPSLTEDYKGILLPQSASGQVFTLEESKGHVKKHLVPKATTFKTEILDLIEAPGAIVCHVCHVSPGLFNSLPITPNHDS